MAMTRAQFVTEICDVVGKNVSAAAVSGASLQDRVVTYLNWAQRRIARFYSFDELNALNEDAVTVTDVKSYPLVTGTNNLGLTNFKDINSIRLIDSENSRKLERWLYRNLDKKFPRPENYAGARPIIYARWANRVEMYRIPDAEYTLHIRYSKWPTELSTVGQVSDYLNKDELIVAMGVFETYLALQEYPDAAVFLQKSVGLLTDAARAEGNVDWEPQAEGMFTGAYDSGTPWLDPYGSEGDPLYNYPE